MRLPEIQRRQTKPVKVGSVTIGGGSGVSVQSMTNTLTSDVPATVGQIQALAAAGADLVRVAVPSRKDTAALAEIISASPVPVIADVHFHFDRALEAIEAGAAKIRLNPGNICDRNQVSRVIRAAAQAGIAIRVGVNEGSAVDRGDPDQRQADLKKPLAELMADKLSRYLEIFNQADDSFGNIVLSAKSRDAFTTIAVNRILAQRWDYPLHLGVTHAGTAQSGAIRSTAALATLLAEGIGDTIRISYAGDPINEVHAAVELLCSLRLRERRSVEIIACPTCGRTQMDVATLADQIGKELADVTDPITVAVMGCVVNGPGEADNADVAVCAAKDKAVLFRRGKKIRTVQADQIVQAVITEVRNL